MIRETKKKEWKTKILRIAIAETIYDFWRSRNENLFSQKNMKSILIENIIHNMVVRCNLYRDLKNHVNASALCIDYDSCLTLILWIDVY